MKQYLVTAYDYTHEDALQNRIKTRPHHLVDAKDLKEKGNFIIGGAILNDDGKMIGSVMVLQFETDEELEAWKKDEPYITQNVWETVDIKPFKMADV